MGLDRQAHLEVLRQTQYASAPELAQYQANHLRPLIAHAGAHVPHYRDSGILDPVFSNGKFDFRRWREIPLLARPQAQAAGDRLFSTQLQEDNAQYISGQTSGSTARPLAHRRSVDVETASESCVLRHYEWHNVDRQATFACIFIDRTGGCDYPHGRKRSNPRANDANHDVWDLSINTIVTDQVKWLTRLRPKYIATHPSNARALAQTVDPHSEMASSIESIFTISENVTEDTRHIISSGFRNANLLDNYGAEEVGCMAVQCEMGTYHFNAETVFLEVIDEDGAPIKPGEIGRVVVTPLFKFAMPMIRYDIGDFAETMAGRCRCGRTLPPLRRIKGRERNMFIFADGSQVWPNIWSKDVQRIVPLKQVQHVQLSFDHIKVRYVPDHPNQKNDTAGLQELFRSVLQQNVHITLEEMTEIPRGAGGKFEDYVCLVDRS